MKRFANIASTEIFWGIIRHLDEFNELLKTLKRNLKL